MGIIENYKDYRKNKPQYEDWSKQRNLEEAKRIAYLKKNNIDPKTQRADIERAKTVLDAVGVMDEFSQSRAEEMEMTTEAISSAAAQVSSYVGVGLAGLSIFASKKVRGTIESLLDGNKKLSPLLAIPAILFIAPTIASGIFMNIYGAKQETRASRLGRIEAIEKQLKSPKQFAVLTEEQEKQVNEIAKTIPVSKEEVKKQTKVSKGFGIMGAINTLRYDSKNKENQEKLNELQEKFKQQENNVKSDKPLTPEQIEEAKKDRQLVQNIVEKIDIASQEYAENTELATGTFQAAALGSGGLLGGAVKWILSKTQIPKGKASAISLATGGIAWLGITLWATKLQKAASRVGRFKVKQDFMKHPEKLVYVDDEKTKDITGVEVETKKKQGFFSYLKSVVKDNQEYNQYQKQHRVENIQKAKAREQIEITPEQEKRAKQLQNNVFKMFNKVDEKSQTYSESTEALGGIVELPVSVAGMIPGLIGYCKNLNKISSANSMEQISKKNIFGMAASFVAMLAPAVIMNIIVTKEQKSASRVADMLAIKELDDYRHFADYSDDNSQKQTQPQKNEDKTQKQTSAASSKSPLENMVRNQDIERILAMSKRK